MEDIVKEPLPPPSSSVVSGKSKLRYPLRSATKSKEEKEVATGLSSSSASRRGRPVSTVSKSVGVLDLSGKQKSSTNKPPRRLSTPAKSLLTPPSRTTGNNNITPIPETRTKRPINCQGKSDTPLSNASRTTSARKKFDVLASTSYWLQQIKLSESAAKHSISLGLFKLALEAGCEPLQQMRNELKSYVRRHELGEQLGEFVEELYQRYDISDNQEQVQVSETCSQVPEEGTRSSDEEVHSSSSAVGTRKLRPRSLNTDAVQVSSVTESSSKEVPQKNHSAMKIRGSLNKGSANSRSVSDTGSRKKLQKKPQKPSKMEANKEKDKIRHQGKKSTTDEGSVSPVTAVDTPEGNKENMGASTMEEISLSPTEGVM